MVELIVVDDEDLEREGIASFLPWEELGIRIAGTARNGKEGLRLIERKHPDIVITDIRMPVMNGLDMIRAAREISPGTVFVILSGYGDFDYTSQAMELGIRHYMLKPCEDEKILKVIRNVLRELETNQRRDEELKGAAHLKALLNDQFFARVPGTLEQSREESRKQRAEEVLESLSAVGRHTADSYESVCRTCYLANLKLRLLQFSLPDRARLFGWMFRETMQNGFAADLEAAQTEQQLLGQMIAGMSSMLCLGGSRREPDERILREIYLHMSDQSLSAVSLASDVLYLSADHFGRRVREITGKNFTTYVNEVRIDAARKLIDLNPKVKMTVVAELTGFASDEQYFSRVFRRLTGMRPREYAAAASEGVKKAAQ